MSVAALLGLSSSESDDNSNNEQEEPVLANSMARILNKYNEDHGLERVIEPYHVKSNEDESSNNDDDEGREDGDNETNTSSKKRKRPPPPADGRPPPPGSAPPETVYFRDPLSDLKLPPMPSYVKVDGALKKKLAAFIKKSQNGIRFNDHLRSLKEFYNPRTLEKLVSRYDIDEYATTLKREQWDPHRFPAEDMREGLRAQQKELEKRRQARQEGREQVEFKSATAPKKATSAAAKKPVGKQNRKKARKEYYKEKLLKEKKRKRLV